jgi:hypothetical protein
MEHSPLAALEQATLSTVLEYLDDVDLLAIGECVRYACGPQSVAGSESCPDNM